MSLDNLIVFVLSALGFKGELVYDSCFGSLRGPLIFYSPSFDTYFVDWSNFPSKYELVYADTDLLAQLGVIVL